MSAAPARLLISVAGIDAVGSGLFAAVSIVFFERHSGLSGTQIGLMLSIGGIAAVFVPSLAAALVDRIGSRRVAVTINLLLVPTFVAMTWVHGFGALVVVVAAALALQRCNDPVRRIIITELVALDEQMRLQAALRTASNAGIAVGALLAVPALSSRSDTLLVVTVVVNSGTFLVAAAGSLAMPDHRTPTSASRSVPAHPADADTGGARSGGSLAGRTRVHRRATGLLDDRRLLAVSLLMGALGMTEQILLVGIPLLVLSLPRSLHVLIGLTLVLNTAIVLARQIPTARGVTDAAQAFRRLRTGAWMFAGGCALLGVTAWLATDRQDGRPAVLAAVVLFAVAVLSLSEVFVSTAANGVLVHTSEPDVVGRRQGILTLGVNLRNLAGPLLISFVASRSGATGWLVLALAGLAALPAVTRQRRHVR